MTLIKSITLNLNLIGVEIFDNIKHLVYNDRIMNVDRRQEMGWGMGERKAEEGMEHFRISSLSS